MSKKRIVAIILGCLLGVAVVSAIVAAVVVGTKQEGHSYSEEWAFDETYHWHTCTDDGCDVVSEKAAHIWGDGEELKAATCMEAGVIAYTCTQCGYKMEETTDALGHQYGAWKVTVPASCSAKGELQRTCEECGDIQTEELDMLEHTFVQHEAQEPTCTQPGWDAYVTCSVCDYTTYQEKEPLGHKIEGEWQSDATGHWRVCVVCGEADEVEMHVSSGAASETQSEVCLTCGYVIAPATGHIHTADMTRWYFDETSHWRRCTGCEEKLMLEGHSGGIASCTEQAVCDICSEAYGELSAHSFTRYISNHDATCTKDGTKTATCDHCSQTDTQTDVGSALGHIWTETPDTAYIQKVASCTERAVYYVSCSRCKEAGTNTFEYGEALGHSFVNEWSSSLDGHWLACAHPGCTERGEFEEHIYTESEKSVSCTEDGYRQYFCEECGYLYKTDIVFAYGHAFGAWETVKAATCTTVGSEQRSCEYCGETETRGIAVLQHDYVVTSVEALADGEQKTYECRNCGHTYIVKDASAADAYSNGTITHCPVDFVFDVVFDGSLTELKEHVTIIDAYFEGTEYEFSELSGAVQSYQVQQKGNDVWTILPQSPYEEGLTYRATVSGGVRFADYNGSVLYFTIDKEPTTEIEVREEVLFLGAMEEMSPGYFPYDLEFSEDADAMYLTLQKIDDLKIGDIICVGPARNMDEVMSDGAEENHFGKIAEFYDIPGGGYMVRLVYPTLEEIFDRLDVYVEELINFESADVEFAEDIEEQAVQSLYASEDFVEFLSSVTVAADTYLSENNYDTKVASTRSILDRLSITPSISINGTTVKVGLTGAIDIPIKAQSQTIGTIRISFSTTADVSFRLEAGLKLKYFLWVIPVGINYFDLRLVQQDTFDFTFEVEFDIDYTLQENNSGYILYSSTAGVRTLHVASCRVIKNADNSRKLHISRDAVVPYLQDPTITECGVCKAKTRLSTNGIYLLNEETHTFHIISCSFAPSVAESKISVQYAEKLMAQGYSPCGHCHPERREEQVFESYMFDSVNYADWNETVSQIKNWANSTGTSDKSESGFTLCRLSFPIVIFTANLEIKLNLNFKIEAAITYHYEVTHENVYGFRIDGNGARTYTERYQQEPVNELDAIGKAEFHAGIGVDAYVSVLGLSSILRAGIYGEAGIYAEAAGVVHISSADNNYAAAYLEAGLYADVEVYYKAFIWEGSADIVNAEWPLWVMGYDRAYHSFVNYFDELSIDGSISLAQAGLLDVYYFDLRTLSDKTGTLSANGVEGQYSISFELESGEYCSVRNGILYIDADAPCMFTDTLTISVEGSSTWKEYVRGNSVFYLGEVSVPIVYKADRNHAYVETSRIEPTCTGNGSATYTCSRCGDTMTEVVEALGHDFIRHPGQAATCTESGWNEYVTCSRCDYTTYKEIVANGHTPGAAATCTTAQTCSVCGVELVPATGHTEVVDKAVAPTCTETGLTEGKHCSVCGEVLVEQEPIDALGHSFTNYIFNDDATCTEDGTETATCDNGCGIKDTRTVEGTAKGHTPAATVRENEKEATCEEAGSYEEVIYCTECKTELSRETKPINALGHTYVDGVCTICGKRDETYATEGLVFTLSDDGTYYSVTDYAGSSAEVYIPSVYNGLPVTAIGESAFEYCRSLTSVTIPDSVTSIGYGAFGDCSSLTSITIPDSVTSIGDDAFSECTGLTSVTIGNGVTSIGKRAFEDCNGLTSIVIPDSVTSIGESAFEGCDGLTSITIGNGVTSIGIFAFDGCENVKDLTLGKGITQLGYRSFGRLSKLETVYFNAVNCNDLDSWGSDVFNGSGVSSRGITLTIGKDVERVPAHLFDYGSSSMPYSTKLMSVLFEEGGKCSSIGEDAFAYSSITSIIIPETITSIESGAFSECYKLLEVYNLSSLSITKGDTSHGCVGFYALNVYTSLEEESRFEVTDDDYLFYHTDEDTYYLVSCLGESTELTLPENIHGYSYSIYNYAFSYIYHSSVDYYDLNPLKSISIPSGVSVIGERAFYGCSSLISVTIPDSVTFVGRNAFLGCSSLMNVNITDIAAWCAIDFVDEYANPLNYAHNLYLNGELVSELTIPEGVTSIGNYAFYGCRGLTSITIPDSVTSIGNSAFRESNLETIVIPDSVTSIGYYAFYSCDNLTSVIFKNPNGWSADSISLSAEELSDPATAANYLRDTYYYRAWTRE